ncbi:transposase [Paenibacillus aurantiacus]|uniref:Transposase n=1 Tax=Paenibacillus aurantiacus TaxID=1936118 RepID=A0ABV5KRX8_9BACL
MKVNCTKAAGKREIKASLEYLLYKQQARERLKRDDGYTLSVRRMHEPESVFGQMKYNRGFRRKRQWTENGKCSYRDTTL